ncbi:PDZ domain-containing protein [Nitratifractor salsuginis]|uniref:PDZ/DHR/GLGF domain protein n=1 Tax=Nitratifractor salsuginis (strain DSM 16511 / JCM 12458 / E9I37-1) TaxID=749222 RepID=E6WY72_NITSE|nr:PDZ domain-containing protein [Nitratifractor salsuginis]ADV45320.1 PDZ/DHR/GLGF domain protein [Nitratifractor salsuginis DSM 16511]
MNGHSKFTPLIRMGAILLLILAAVTLLWTVVSTLFLPLSGVEKERRRLVKPLPRSYRIASDKALRKPVVHPRPQPRESIGSLTLQAVYKGPQRSVAVIAKGNKSYVVRLGEELLGYRLKEVGDRYAVLEKNGHTYRLVIKETPLGKATVSVPGPDAQAEATSSAKEIRRDGDVTIVPKTLIHDYTKNVDKIWKNIGIVPQKRGNNIAGFRVRFVKRGSVFEKLGLQRGDIITAINGEPIQDLGTVMELYRSSDSLDELSITVKRKNSEVELNYEIQ